MIPHSQSDLSSVLVSHSLDLVLHLELTQGGHAEAAGGADRPGGLHLRPRPGGDQGGGGDQDGRRPGPHHHGQRSRLRLHQGGG